MNHEAMGAVASIDYLETVLWSARRAGSWLIVPNPRCDRTRLMLTEQGLARETMGQLVLTHKGRERRRLIDPINAVA